MLYRGWGKLHSIRTAIFLDKTDRCYTISNKEETIMVGTALFCHSDQISSVQFSQQSVSQSSVAVRLRTYVQYGTASSLSVVGVVATFATPLYILSLERERDSTYQVRTTHFTYLPLKGTYSTYTYLCIICWRGSASCYISAHLSSLFIIVDRLHCPLHMTITYLIY